MILNLLRLLGVGAGIGAGASVAKNMLSGSNNVRQTTSGGNLATNLATRKQTNARETREPVQFSIHKKEQVSNSHVIEIKAEPLSKTKVESLLRYTKIPYDTTVTDKTNEVKSLAKQIVTVESISPEVSSNFKIIGMQIDLLSQAINHSDRKFKTVESNVNQKLMKFTDIINQQTSKLADSTNKSIKSFESSFKKHVDRIQFHESRMHRLEADISFLKLKLREQEIEQSRNTSSNSTVVGNSITTNALLAGAAAGMLGLGIHKISQWVQNDKNMKNLSASNTALKATTATASVIRAAVRKIAAKEGVKVLTSKIPFFGLGVAAFMAGARFMRGDINGAVAELGAGAAATIPGVGTAGSLLASIGLLARDVYVDVYKLYPENDPKSEERWKAIYDEAYKYVTNNNADEQPKESETQKHKAEVDKLSTLGKQALNPLQNKWNPFSWIVGSDITTQFKEKEHERITKPIKIETRDNITLKAKNLIIDVEKIEYKNAVQNILRQGETARKNIASRLPSPVGSEILSGANALQAPNIKQNGNLSYGGGSTYSDTSNPGYALQSGAGMRDAQAIPTATSTSSPNATSWTDDRVWNKMGQAVNRDAVSRTGVPVTGPDGSNYMNVSRIKEGQRFGSFVKETSAVTPGVVPKDVAKEAESSTRNYSPGGIDRRKFEQELANNPALRTRLMTLIEAEAGSQGVQAQQAVLETMMNRAELTGKTLEQIISNRAYYQPYKDGGYARAAKRLNEKKIAQLEGVIDEVLGGSDLTGGATHNASAGVARSVRRGGYDADTKSIVEFGGETFYRKTLKNERGELPRLPDDITNVASGPMKVGLHDVEPEIVDKESFSPNVRELQQKNARTRKRALSPELRRSLDYISSKTGVRIDVWSGGQYKKGQGPRTGSTRHDDGHAADVDMFWTNPETGKEERLSVTNPRHRKILEEVYSAAGSAGLTGFGQAPGYMSKDGSRAHLGFSPKGPKGREGTKSGIQTWSGTPRWVSASAAAGRENLVDLDEWKKQERTHSPRVSVKEEQKLKNVPLALRGMTTPRHVQEAAMGKPQKPRAPQTVNEKGGFVGGTVKKPPRTKQTTGERGGIVGGEPAKKAPPEPEKEVAAKTDESTTAGYSGAPEGMNDVSSPTNNYADSMPPGQGDDGYGSYAECVL